MIVRDTDKLSLQDYQMMIDLPLKGPDEREALMMFLKRLPVPSPHPLLAQMFWRIGTRLDATIVATVLRSTEANYLGMEVVPNSNVDESFFDLNQKVISYWNACGKAQAGVKSYSLAVDKSRVMGMGVMNCFFALPDNTGHWGPPQVVIVATQGR